MTALELAHCLARGFFSDAVCVVDNTVWPGAETDLLVVNWRLQVIDVEIKVCRADLARDRMKDKWYKLGENFVEVTDARGQMRRRRERVPVEWPRRVWKHYIAMPAAIWRPSWIDLVQKNSGVILVDFARPEASDARRAKMAARPPQEWHHRVIKRAKPRPDYQQIGGMALVEIARLASVRMWEAYADRRPAAPEHHEAGDGQ